MRALAAGVIGGLFWVASATAQPSADDKARAKDLYRAAEAEMAHAQYADAIRDYGAAYDLTKDPTLFFKIAAANEKAGKCETAVVYYRRYLKDGKPTEKFAAQTKLRIVGCGATVEPVVGGAGSGGTGTGSGTGTGTGTDQNAGGAGTNGTIGGAGSATGNGTNTGGGAAGSGMGKGTGKGTDLNAGSGSNGANGTNGADETNRAGGAGTDGTNRTGGAGADGTNRNVMDGSKTGANDGTDGSKPGGAGSKPHGSRGAWLCVGGAITFVTIGAVLAYAASSTEADITDLYSGLGGMTPTYDALTKKRFDDLVSQGERYQHLSWAAFGIGGAAAIGATILFATHHDESIVVAPTATSTSAGATAMFRF